MASPAPQTIRMMQGREEPDYRLASPEGPDCSLGPFQR